MLRRPVLTLGLDLGQSFDYSALVALQHRPGTPADPGVRYVARMLERWRGRPYTELSALLWRAQQKLRQAVSDDFVAVHGKSLHLWHDIQMTLVVDASGVGAAVVDALVTARLQPVPVIITSGVDVHPRDGGGYTVPKLDLVTTVQLLLEQRRLQLPTTLPHAETLAAELRNFKYDFTPSGKMRFGAGPSGGEDVLWRGDGSHDDLILATAVAAWHAEQQTTHALDPRLIAAWGDRAGGWRS